MEREHQARQYIKKIYNKTRDHFESDDAYDTYLEEIEDKIFLLSSSDRSLQDDKRRLQNQLNRDKQEQSQDIANIKAKNQEQMKQFRMLVNLHQKETDKFKPNNFFSMAATVDPANNDQEMAETNKLKQCLEKFDLDNYGKHGIELSEDEVGDQPPAGGGADHFNIWYEPAVHKHQNKTKIRLVKEPQARAEYVPPSREVQAEIGGQKPSTHCRPLRAEYVEKIPLPDLQGFQSRMQQASPW